MAAEGKASRGDAATRRSRTFAADFQGDGEAQIL
jgi:hypothetical protein